MSDDAQPRPTTFVLVHGAWSGSWEWERVGRLLSAHGHHAYAPTLSGLGERSHLADRTIDLTTHILDVVNEIIWKDLDQIVLVGHSYGGLVISGVAEKVFDRIAAIVYMDAFILENGQSFADIGSGLVDPTETLMAPFESSEGDFLREEDRALSNRKVTPHPVASFTEKLWHTDAYQRVPKKVFIQAMGWETPFTETVSNLRAAGDWTIYEVPCGHDIALDDPERLVEILEALI